MPFRAIRVYINVPQCDCICLHLSLPLCLVLPLSLSLSFSFTSLTSLSVCLSVCVSALLITHSLVRLIRCLPQRLSRSLSFLPSRSIYVYLHLLSVPYSICVCLCVYLHLYSKRLKWIFISCFCYQLPHTILFATPLCNSLAYHSKTSLSFLVSPLTSLALALLCITNAIFIRIYFHFGLNIPVSTYEPNIFMWYFYIAQQQQQQ